MKTKSYLTKTEQIQRLVKEYREQGNEWPTDRRHIAAWIIRQGYWKPDDTSQIDMLAPDVSRALRSEYMTDPQGRKIRKKHAAKFTHRLKSGKIVQQTLWADIEEASADHMQLSFQQRRMQILGDCHQMKNDVDSYNENYNNGTQLQFSYNFEEDLLELSMPEHYDEIEPTKITPASIETPKLKIQPVS